MEQIRPSNLRTHGAAPYAVAVVHGGPGAAGDMAAVAEQLAGRRGVLEPLQTAASVDGQVEELAAVLQQHAQLPATLIGYSWGAWLALIVAARRPELVAKLILVGSGPFEERYAAEIMPERLRRLSGEERNEVEAIMSRLSDAPGGDDAAFARMGELLGKADAFDPLPDDHGPVDVQAEIYASVWPQAAELRRSGGLLDLAAKVTCPVVAIHGAYDPHPAEGVRAPLARVVADFRFVLLPECGHTPWLERRARDEFYRLLESELAAT
jgi:pimeloyl-ACP methyl ester carboxylesterase